MPRVLIDVPLIRRAHAVGLMCAANCCLATMTLSVVMASVAVAQVPSQFGSSFAPQAQRPTQPPNHPVGLAPRSPDEVQVVGVRVEGNHNIPLGKIEPHVKTRPGHKFNIDSVNGDVRRLNRTGLFLNVRALQQMTPQGVIVVFQVTERRRLRYVKFIGNQSVKRERLSKEAGLKVGAPLDPYMIEEARRKVQEFYESQGFAMARVSLAEGARPTDHGATLVIHEGPRRRVWGVEFVGNTIASNGRLKTKISSKPPVTWPVYFGNSGAYDRKVVTEDVKKLTAYYRSLGFFRARIGPEIETNEAGDRVSIRFVIDEGPRYVVRNVSVIGNTTLTSEELMANLHLESGDFFDQGRMTKDVKAIQDRYGGQGYIYADVSADLRYVDGNGRLDLVYKLAEGDRYRISHINVHIGGDSPHTRRSVVLNRLSIKSGDIADTREVRDSTRRLKASALFARQQPGVSRGPRITFRHPEKDAPRTNLARGRRPGPNYRGQSPDTTARPTHRPLPAQPWRLW
jgi:outer membrane protein insertion porin family